MKDIILKFLAEIEDFGTLRQMSDEELSQLFKTWLHSRRLQRVPTALPLPLKVTWPERGWKEPSASPSDGLASRRRLRLYRAK